MTPPVPPGSSPAPLDSLSTQLRQTWEWFNAHFPNLLKISACFLGVQIVLAVVLVVLGVTNLVFGTRFDFSETSLPRFFGGIAIFVMSFGFISLWNTLALYTYIIRNDRSYPLSLLLRDSVKKILPYIKTSLLVGLLVVAGTILFVIPGVYWGVLYGFAPLIVLVEGNHVRAFDRSKQLVSGYWWPVFLRQLAIGLIVYVISLIINSIFSRFITSLGSTVEPLRSLKNIGDFFSNIIFAPISLIFSYLVYQNLRRFKG